MSTKATTKKEVMNWWNSMSDNQKFLKVAESRYDISLDRSKDFKNVTQSDIENIFQWNLVYGDMNQ